VPVRTGAGAAEARDAPSIRCMRATSASIRSAALALELLRRSRSATRRVASRSARSSAEVSVDSATAAGLRLSSAPTRVPGLASSSVHLRELGLERRDRLLERGDLLAQRRHVLGYPAGASFDSTVLATTATNATTSTYGSAKRRNACAGTVLLPSRRRYRWRSA
jgi:hypothetical protein